MGFSLFISIYKNSKPIVKTYDETGDPPILSIAVIRQN
jgi:hypothetical protein